MSGVLGVPRNIAAYFELIKQNSPDVVISDFESWTYLFGKSHGIPVISVDNMQIINRCELPHEITAGAEADFQIAKTFVKSKLPFCKQYLITTFFPPPVRKPDTSLHPPILRPEILAAKPTKGEHLLVYQTAEGGDTLALRAHGIGGRAIKRTGKARPKQRINDQCGPGKCRIV